MYNRLFSKILDSSIWLEPDSTRIVWFTLLASMDQDGYCHYSALENLASRARVSVAKTRRAIECFMSPDPDSENEANEGKRIDRVPGGYLVLNAEYYRNKFTREIEREQTRLRVAKHRAKNGQCSKSSVTKALHPVSPVSVSDSSSVSACKKKAENEEEVIQYCISIGLTQEDGSWFWDKCEGNGWKNNGKPIVDWKATVRSWKRTKSIFPSQKPIKINVKFDRPSRQTEAELWYEKKLRDGV